MNFRILVIKERMKDHLLEQVLKSRTILVVNEIIRSNRIQPILRNVIEFKTSLVQIYIFK